MSGVLVGADLDDPPRCRRCGETILGTIHRRTVVEFPGGGETVEGPYHERCIDERRS